MAALRSRETGIAETTTDQASLKRGVSHLAAGRGQTDDVGASAFCNEFWRSRIDGLVGDEVAADGSRGGERGKDSAGV